MLLGILNSQAAGGGGGAYDLLETTTLTSAAASVSFTGLGSYSDYTHLQVRYAARTTRGSTTDLIEMRLNGNSGSNYASHFLRGDGSVGSGGFSSVTVMRIGHLSAASAAANNFAVGVIDFLDAFSTNKNTTVRSLTGGTVPNEITLGSGLFINTSSITSMEFDNLAGNFVTGCRFSLYGIKGA